MKSLKLVGVRELEFFDRPEPRVIYPDDVKIQVKYVGVCVDDMSFFKRDKDMLAWGCNLLPLNGHEMSGIVVECGEDAIKFGIRAGDRVSGYAWRYCGDCYYCRMGRENHCLNLVPAQGTLSEYIVWSARQLIVLPPNVSMEEGCLTDPVGYAIYGAEKAGVSIGDKVLIIGGTLNGQLMVQMMRRQGASRLTLLTAEASNRQLAESLGADHTIDPDDANMVSEAFRITDGLGYDVIFETTGDIEMLSLALKLLARRGKILFSNMYGINKVLPVSISELYLKEAALIPYYAAPYMLPRIRNIIGELELKPLITKIYDFKDAIMAYKDTETGVYPHILIKVSD